MTPSRSCLIALLLLAASGAHADVFKCVDDAGHITYTNDKVPPSVQKCSLMSREQPVSSIAPQPTTRKAANAAASTPSPSTFPKVDDSTQKSRDTDRRTILETELAAEQKKLEAAKKQLTEQEAVRNGDEKNYQKYLDRIEQYKNDVQVSERNIEAIRKEIGNLK